MDKEFKVIVDEQSKQSLDRLKSCFEELLQPLEKLDALANRLDSLEESSGAGNREIKGKLSEILNVVETIKKKSGEISECQEDVLSKVDFLKREITDFKEGLKAIDWN